jgi:outer membrane protein TolC
MTSRTTFAMGAALLLTAFAAGAAGQDRVATPAARVTFKDAVSQAVQRNPSVQQAASEILRAQALLRAARAAILPAVDGSATNTTLNASRSFGGVTTTPQDQASFAITASALLVAPAQWAMRVQASDTVQIAEVAASDAKRQVAFSTAEAYLAIVARRRVREANERARDVARAHYELAKQLREAGAGSVLNELRAQQALSSDEVLLEQSAIDVYRAQEALGVLLAADGPVDAADEPVLDVPADLQAADAAMPALRTDIQLAVAREHAAERVVTDTWKEALPVVSGLFQPQYFAPSTVFQPASGWRAEVLMTVPIFDAGARAARRGGRESLLEETRTSQAAALRQAHSDVRTAEEAVKSAERALASARAAAEQARRVLEIVNVSFRTGASTNIEVIDAQRAERDADTAAAIAEDQLRVARLTLLVALGRFP